MDKKALYETNKKALYILWEHLLSGANLIAIGTLIFYTVLQNILFTWFHAIFLRVKDLIPTRADKSDFFEAMVLLFRNIEYLGYGLVIVLFVVSQLVNYKKKNISWLSFFIISLVFAGFGLMYWMTHHSSILDYLF